VIRDLVRTHITPQLRKAFARLSPDLVEHHAKDIQHVPATDPAKKVATTTTSFSPTQTAATSSKPAEPPHSKGRVLNTVTVSETYEFNTSADQLYQTFVDPQRVAAFTRTPPREFEPKEGGKFNLFGGNVEGTFKTLEQDKKIIQEWRLGSWPKGELGPIISSITTDVFRPLLNHEPRLRPGHRLDQPESHLDRRPCRPG